jgi:TolB-like protein/Flp pilus assembly protein TadD
MKRIGKITSIPLEEHVEILGLLNETIGGSAGSSQSAHLLPRIYRKWKDSLSDLENAPLFKVLGKKRNSEEGFGATYLFTEEEKDAWANLFEYRGSEEHVRLRFSFDKLGAGLDDVVINYGKDPELADDAAWNRFIADLRQEDAKQQVHAQTVPEERESGIPPSTKRKVSLSHRWKWATLAAGIAVVAVFTIRHFYFRPPPIEPASVDRMAFPLPDKPSIAVLPFINLSGDPNQEYLSDGFTEEIITALSKVPYLFVIARNSTFSYKGKPVKISRIAEELGVRYVLEGSFRRAGDRVRVTAQLIDAIKGHHLWAERYERKLKDIFALQDEITTKILWALELKFKEGKQASTHRKVTDNLEAYLKTVQAMEGLDRVDRKGNLLARQRAEEAIALDPKYARAYRVLASSHVMDVLLGMSKSPKNSLEQADTLIQKAFSLDESDPCGYEVLSFICLMKGQHDRAIAEAKQAIALDPNGAYAFHNLGVALTFAGRPEEAIAWLEKAIRINPIAPGGFFLDLGSAYRDAGRYEEAIEKYRKAISLTPDSPFAHGGLVATYSLAGRVEEARAEVEELLKINPRASIKDLKILPYKNPADRERIADALRRAVLK